MSSNKPVQYTLQENTKKYITKMCMNGECKISKKDRKTVIDIANQNTVSYLDLQKICAYFRTGISDIRLNSKGIDLFLYLESKAQIELNRANLQKAILDRDSQIYQLTKQNEKIQNMILTDKAGMGSLIKTTRRNLSRKLDEQNIQLKSQDEQYNLTNK